MKKQIKMFIREKVKKEVPIEARPWSRKVKTTLYLFLFTIICTIMLTILYFLNYFFDNHRFHFQTPIILQLPIYIEKRLIKRIYISPLPTIKPSMTPTVTPRYQYRQPTKGGLNGQ